MITQSTFRSKIPSILTRSILHFLSLKRLCFSEKQKIDKIITFWLRSVCQTLVILYKNKEQLRIEYFITQQKIGTNINRKKQEYY